MAADGSIGWTQFEDWLASLLCHRHKAAVVLDGGEAVRVRSRSERTSILAENTLPIHSGHSIDPAVVSFHRTTEANAVLLNDVTQWLDLPRRQCKGWGPPIIHTLSPGISPRTE